MILIPYDPWDAGLGVPGTWHGGMKADGSRTALLCCPDCKAISTLTGHEIKIRGFVSPSLVCRCGWHEFVQLGGWDTPK